EPSLRRVVVDLAPRVGFEPHVAVLPITVAALMTTNWVARHLPDLPAKLDRVVLPGFCRGDIEDVSRATGAHTVRGPIDLRDLRGTGTERERHERRTRAALAPALPRGGSGRDPGYAERPRLARTHRRCAALNRDEAPARPDTRTDRLRVRRVARALHRNATQ